MKKPLRDPRLTAVSFVADAVNRPLDLKEIADNALHAILSVMKLDAGALYVRQPDHARLELLAARGLPDNHLLSIVPEPMLNARVKEAGFESVIVAPVRAEGGVDALLALGARAVRVFTEADRELVEVMANQIGNAMMHAQLQADLRQKNKLLELLIEEAHHRIKNNLQMISGLLQIQSDDHCDAATGEALRTAIMRIQAIAHVHNLLSAEMPEKVDARKLIEAVVSAVHSGTPVELQLAELWLGADQAVALALIVNELVANSQMHGRPANGAGLLVRVTCGREGTDGVVEVTDNGGGLPATAQLDEGQGISIVRQLARVNLRGSLTLTSQAAGLCGRLRFPIVL